jgi:hypothetical protein
MPTRSGDDRARCGVSIALGFTTIELLLTLLLQSSLSQRRRAGLTLRVIAPTNPVIFRLHSFSHLRYQIPTTFYSHIYLPLLLVHSPLSEYQSMLGVPSTKYAKQFNILLNNLPGNTRINADARFSNEEDGFEVTQAP